MASKYERIGLKCGIEIHQRLKSHKLFCGCSSGLVEETPMMEVKRKLRAVAGELGEVDRAALHEYLRDREFLYEVYEGETCLVELDEEPPLPLNEEALDIGLEVSLLFNARIPDEIHIMRKTVVDGSNTSGFQRTCMIGLDGDMDGPRGKLDIPLICLEEEAAGIGGSKGGVVVYKLDRLGIPLVEVATGLLEGYSPEQVQEVALRMGMILRMTGKVQRGIGTIRQDVNVSIERGARVEIKGFQEIGRLAELIKREAERQLSLIAIKDELSRHNVEVSDPVKADRFFSDLEKGPIARVIKKGGAVSALKLSGFTGILGRQLCPGRTFGRELADHAKAYDIGGIIHTDEDLVSAGLEENFRRLGEHLSAGGEDAVLIMAGDTEAVERAMKAVRERALWATKGLPEETREPNTDYTTSYKRPLPGSSRMYPETDIPPIPISRDRVEEIRKLLPEKPEAKRERFIEAGMSEDLADQLVRDENLPLFESMASRVDIDPTLLASTLVNTFRSLRRDGAKVDSLTEEELLDLFTEVARGSVVKEEIERVLSEMARGARSLKEILSEDDKITEEDLRCIVKTILTGKSNFITERGERSFGPIMGEVMKQVRGKIDGAIVGRVVRELLGEVLQGEN